jgi:ankyrin repeat protein
MLMLLETNPVSPTRLRRRLILGLISGAAACTAGRAAAQSGPAAADREALFRAVRRDDAHAVRTALLRGADSNALDDAGEPAIVLAARSKCWNAVRALAELRGTRLDATNQDGSNTLMYAALHGETELVKSLVGRKAEVNKTGWTPLHFAAANGHLEVIRFLLEHHAYIDAESPNGTTPLMMAARQAQPSSVRLLLEEGADPTPRNQSGLDAAAYAKLAGDIDLSNSLARQAQAYRQKYRATGSKP